MNFIHPTQEDLEGKAWHLKLPHGEKGHEYVDVQHSRGGAPNVFYIPDKDFLVISLFVFTIV